MKFGKRLKQQIEQSFPDWRDKFLSYKELKKLVRQILVAAPVPRGRPSEYEAGATEAEFVYLLNHEIEKFNAFYMEQEEDFIIRHKELQQRIWKVREEWVTTGIHPSELEYKEEMAKLREDMVNFHGEMVLLLNYSSINYTGLAKILKKYDKRTAGVLRLLLIEKVLDQPFFTIDLISKLVKECETTIDSVLQPYAAVGTFHAERELEEAVAVPRDREGIFRNTVAALTTMKEMRRGSSTYSHFSLPPINLPDFEVIQSWP